MIENHNIEILLVEDNPADIEHILTTFKKHHLINKIFVIHDGAEALDYLFGTGTYADRQISLQPKIILIDPNLSKIHGLEVLRKIKADERTETIPIIILTTSDEERELIDSYNLGVNNYLAKPFEFDKFIQIMTNFHLHWLLLNTHPLQTNNLKHTESHNEKGLISVLYIEDNPNDYLLVKKLLTKISKGNAKEDYFNLEQCDRISKAFDRLAKGGIDIVLTDLNLPDASEIEIITKLLNHFPMMPIVALTNSYDKTFGIEAIKKGAQDYLLKDELTATIIRHSIRYAIERKKLDKMKDDFVSNVSHELITPLTIMKINLDNLNMGVAGPITPKQQEILVPINNNIDRLARIITDILDLSRLEFRFSTVNCIGVNLKTVAEEVISGFHKEAKRKHITIEDNLFSSDEVYADPILLIQVFNSLLSNACRYAKTKIIITSQHVDNMICVSIIDDGPGISEEDQKKLFKKFEQLNRPEGGHGYKGTGLGLAICKEIISKLDGKIWVESNLNHGSEFCFTLPLQKS